MNFQIIIRQPYLIVLTTQGKLKSISFSSYTINPYKNSHGAQIVQ